uniref:hypothetical protein n=1 Tax=Mycobacterium sp. HUMS_1102779 TaxID=3383487 RepID=UPI003899DF78
MYAIAVDGVEVRRKVFLGGLMSRDPQAILRRSVRTLEFLATNLRQLRSVCDKHAGAFASPGFRQLLEMITEQLSVDYLERLGAELAELHLPRGARTGLDAHGDEGNRVADR